MLRDDFSMKLTHDATKHHALLVYNSFLYRRNRDSKSSTYYMCQQGCKSCSVTVDLDAGLIIKRRQHECDPTSYDEILCLEATSKNHKCFRTQKARKVFEKHSFVNNPSMYCKGPSQRHKMNVYCMRL